MRVPACAPSNIGCPVWTCVFIVAEGFRTLESDLHLWEPHYCLFVCDYVSRLMTAGVKMPATIVLHNRNLYLDDVGQNLWEETRLPPSSVTPPALSCLRHPLSSHLCHLANDCSEALLLPCFIYPELLRGGGAWREIGANEQSSQYGRSRWESCKEDIRFRSRK